MSKAKNVKIVYLASLLHYDGSIDHVGRSLTRHLETEHDVQVFGAVVPPDSDLLRGRLGYRLLNSDELSGVDVVYMEGGWTDGSGEVTDRFPLALAEKFVSSGGLLIAADVDRNAAATQQQSLEKASALFGSVVVRDIGRNAEIHYLHDRATREPDGIRFFASQMSLREQLAPALTGIDSLLADGPIKLQLMKGDIAASGNNPSTEVLMSDLPVYGYGPHAWATANPFGRGHAMLIGAWISHDIYVEACPDNARWISNLIALLTDRSREAARWSASTAAPVDGVDLRTLLDEPESDRLERKSSFRVPTDGTRHQEQKDVQFQVAKAIVSLANTAGGHVIIGQADDNTVLGLDKDFATVRGKNRDGFSQSLVEYMDHHLHPRWETLRLGLCWLDHEAGDVAVVIVPAQPRGTVVFAKNAKNGPGAVYVRRGTRSDPVDGEHLVKWLQSRQN
jgi:hypothetical protein